MESNSNGSTASNIAMLEGKYYIHKQEAIYFAMYIISGKPRSLSTTDRHTGKCEAIEYFTETVKIGKNFGKFLVLCQNFYHQTFTVWYLYCNGYYTVLPLHFVHNVL